MWDCKTACHGLIAVEVNDAKNLAALDFVQPAVADAASIVNCFPPGSNLLSVK